LVTTISLFPVLEILQCEDCPLLTSISLLPKLTILDCNSCRLLTSISSSPNLTELVCNDCDILGNIDALNLTILHCSHCPLLNNDYFQQLTKLTYLDCSNCHVIILRYFPVLIKLRCNSCLFLQQIGDTDISLPKLTELSCYKCPILTEIHKLPNLLRLNCMFCPMLQLNYLNFKKLRLIRCSATPNCKTDDDLDALQRTYENQRQSIISLMNTKNPKLKLPPEIWHSVHKNLFGSRRKSRLARKHSRKSRKSKRRRSRKPRRP